MDSGVIGVLSSGGLVTPPQTFHRPLAAKLLVRPENIL